MSSVPAITAGSITGMTGLANRPVYFLKLNGASAPSVVVKGEQVSADAKHNTDVMISIAWSSKIMKNVNNPMVNTKLMTRQEIAVFKQAASASLAVGSPQLANVSQAYNWVKMPMVIGLSDAEVYDDSSNPDTNLLKEVIPKLFDSAIWYGLGEVLAADIFSGNSDRFDVTTGNWVNKGNLMFLGAGVIGLDTFDPNSLDQGNLASKGGFDAMKTLIDQTRRDAFAKNCTKSVGSELARVAKRAGLGQIVATIDGGKAMISTAPENLSRLYERFARDLSRGIDEGARKLKAYLQLKKKDYAAHAPWVRATPQGKSLPQKALPLPPPPLQSTAPQRPLPPLPQRPLPPPPRPQSPAPMPPAAKKSLPQGVIDRMTYLGW